MNNDQRRLRLYIAAPLFSHIEREFNLTLKATLGKYFDVYLPQEDGSLMVDLINSGVTISKAAKQVFQCDLNAIHESDILLIVMDGRSIDEGAAFELGVAFTLGKVCIGLQTDIRRLSYFGNNPMLDCALQQNFQTTTVLEEWANAIASNISSC